MVTSAALPEGPLLEGSLGVSRATIYKYVSELKTGHRPQLEASPQTTRAELPAG